jgi:hypothetical protein
MIKLNWLPNYFNNNLYDGIERINKLKWNLSINYDEDHGIWGVASGEALIFKTDSKEALESFLYGLGLAYNVLPEDVLEQLKKNIEDL